MTSSRTNRGASTLATLVVLILLQGCTAMSRPRAIPDDPEFAPVRPQAMMQRDRASGSIYQVSRNYNFYGDTVALNVGDVLTVTLQESTRASKNADTRIIKDNEIKLPEPNILGKSNFGIGTSLNNERDFKTRADADQSNSLAGSITVSVTEVLPNGVLRIRGEKRLSPRDIQPDNSVASNRIADARIAYGGTGDFDQANQMGWLARFFNSEWWLL